jgi:poly(hydroxyalkanoate) depolymerase family esterase
VPLDWKKVVDDAMQGVGAARPAATGFEETLDFGPNPARLRMFSHVPANLPAGSPLVVVLHGCGQDAAGYARDAGWATLADRFGFAVVAPEQGHANNGARCFNWFLPAETARGSGETASIRQMIAKAAADHAIDPRRVFITGLSAGGAMTSSMLAAYPEVFAGGAVIAGLPHGAAGKLQEALASMRAPPARSRRAWGDLVRAASDHAGPWPRVSVWHGDADHTVGGANAEAVLEQWGDVHGLPAAPSFEDRVKGYPRRVWRGPGGEAMLESYTLTGLGHGTPIDSTPGDEACGAPSAFVLQAGISSSYRIAEFWGLTGEAAETAKPANTRTLPDPRPLPAPEVTYLDFQPVPRAAPPEKSPGRFDPQTVINKALRAAGLM